MICSQCNTPIADGEEIMHREQLLCEDCYIERLEPPKTCDVAAVHSAKMARKLAGQEGTDGLTEPQKAVYNYVQAAGPVTHQQIMDQLQLSRPQLDKIFSTLRHCELLRGFRQEGQVYVTLWGQGGNGETP